MQEARGALRDAEKYAEQMEARVSTALQKAADLKEKLDAAKKTNESLKAQIVHAEKLAQEATAAEKNMKATLDLHMTITEAGLSFPSSSAANSQLHVISLPARLKVDTEERDRTGEASEVVKPKC